MSFNGSLYNGEAKSSSLNLRLGVVLFNPVKIVLKMNGEIVCGDSYSVVRDLDLKIIILIYLGVDMNFEWYIWVFALRRFRQD